MFTPNQRTCLKDVLWRLFISSGRWKRCKKKRTKVGGILCRCPSHPTDSSSVPSPMPLQVVAAVFLATGQHLAHTVEGSKCITLMEEVRAGEETRSCGRHGDLRVSITMPSLLVGTVGGGVDLPGQAACLELAGCRSATSTSEDIAPGAAAEFPGHGILKEATVAVENGGGGGIIEVESSGPVSGSGGGDSGDDRGQRTAISLVAEAAAAAAAAAEAEAAAAKLTLSSGGGGSGGGGSGALGAVGSTPFSSESGVVTGETVVEGMGGEGKEAEASAETGGVTSEANPAAPKVTGGAPGARPISRLPKSGASRLACVVGAAVMAGELSFLAALASNDSASTHGAQIRKKQVAGVFTSGEARTAAAPTVAASSTSSFSTSDAGGAVSRSQEGVGDAEITGGAIASSGGSRSGEGGGAGSTSNISCSSGGGENIWKMNSGALALDGVQVETLSGSMQSETQTAHEPGLTVQPSALQVDSTQGTRVETTVVDAEVG